LGRIWEERSSYSEEESFDEGQGLEVDVDGVPVQQKAERTEDAVES
jgi:hypothetical protein